MLYGLPIKLVLLAFKSHDEIKDESLAYQVYLWQLRKLVAFRLSQVKKNAFTSTYERMAFTRFKLHHLPYYVRQVRRGIFRPDKQ